MYLLNVPIQCSTRANKKFRASAMHGAKLRKRSEQTKKTARKLAGLKKKPVKDCLFYMICGKKCFNLHLERNVPPGQEGPAMWHGSLATYSHEKSNSLVPHHPTRDAVRLIMPRVGRTCPVPLLHRRDKLPHASNGSIHHRLFPCPSDIEQRHQ